MGKKKKFIDKKKSATFQLMARDTSDPNYSSEPAGDRVFICVDNNGYTPQSFFDDGGRNDEVPLGDPNLIFADAPDDCDDEYANYGIRGSYDCEDQNMTLPNHIRSEILELGFPDDGYNYLTHLQEIKNTGGGSAYYHNLKAKFDHLLQDVKAYDSTRVEVPEINDVSVDKSVCSIASKTVGVRLQKVVDPEVAAMLDDSDSSKYGSDVENLEDDFVVRANLLDRRDDEELVKKLSLAGGARVDHGESGNFVVPGNANFIIGLDNEKPRVRRPLDEQFDLLELQEYGTDNEEEFNNYTDEDDECQESLADKLNHAFENHPSDLLHDGKGVDDIESPGFDADVILRCKEYAAKFEDENYSEEVVVESSSESEVWDCETVISTYSILGNHPGKIGAPEAKARRKKQLSETVFGESGVPNQVIALKGKEKLPVDFLPHGRKHVEQKSKDDKDANCKRTELHKRKPHGQESKEEKKERKAAVKLVRREARQMKKEMKGLYQAESQHAQKVAAGTGPSSVHLM